MWPQGAQQVARRNRSVAGETCLAPFSEAAQPSAASWLRMMPGSSDAIQARAASGPRPSPARALARVACTPSGACWAIRCPRSAARWTCAPAGTTSCTSPIRNASAAPELLGGEQEAHRVAPAELRGRAEGGPAERHDAAADLQLAEPHIIGGDHDAGGQRQLDRQGERDAVDRHHRRLGHRVAPDPERVEAVRAAQHLRAVPGHRRVRPVNSRLLS
jgi:hypothetical protein